MANTFDCDRGFISKLLQTKDMLTVKDAQIRVDFLSGESRLAYQYIYDVTISTGEVPSVRAFKRKFPNYELERVYDEEQDDLVVGTEENLQFWCNELRTKKKHNTLADATEKIVQSLEDFDVTTAYDKMKRVIAYIESEVEETHDVDITKDTEDRKKAYLERKKTRGVSGIPTGISHLDYLLRGLAPQTLTTLIANTGVGKRLDLRTPILTPKGFVPLSSIHAGSIVCGEDGKFYPVILDTPVVNTQVYRVTFEDGTHVDCCADHLWKFKTIDDVVRGNDWRVKTTFEILNQHQIKSGRAFNLCIPVNKAIQFEEKELPIPPYALGCLLGDGGFTTDSITFTNTESDVVTKLNNSLKDFGEFVHRKGNPIQYVYKRKHNGNNLFKALDRLHLNWLYSTDKYIPKDYLLSSVEQRTELLQGLIDTDGHVNSKGHTQFFTSSEYLYKDFMYLVRSLGYRCRGHFRRKGFIEYRVTICTDEYIGTSVKHMNKYKNAIKGSRVNYYNHLKIVSIEPLKDRVDMKCLMVDSPDHTFVCGDFIVTHNTWLEVYIGSHAMLNNYRVLQFVTEMSDAQMRDRYEAMLYSMCYGDFNYDNFKRGMLDRKTEKKYFQFLEDDLPNMEPLQIITATGVMSVSAAIDKYKPDLVLIDGVYLMDDDQGADSDWLRVAHITRDLKKLAKRTKLPFFINSQADKNTSKRTGPELGSISYTQAIGQDCLPADTLVLTDCGYKRIQMLEGEVFKVFDGEKYKKAYCTRTGEKPVCIITYIGNEFRCSPEHKVFVYDEQVANFVWKKAKDIEPKNDFLLEQNFSTKEGHSHVLMYRGDREGFVNNIVFPTTADNLLGLFLGIFIGDGSVKPLYKGQVTVSCGQDLEYAHLCLRLVKSLFNLEGRVAATVSTTSGKEEYLATWYSVSFADWLYKFTHDSDGYKDIKIDFVELNENFRIGLLSGLLQSDGTCKSQAEFVTSIRRNAEVFILLCKSLGICTRYDFESNNHRGKYRVRLMTEDVVHFSLYLAGDRKRQFEELSKAKYCGRLNKPNSFVKKFCRALKSELEVNSLDYKKVCIGCKSGQIGQTILDKYSNFPYKFMQVDDVVVTDAVEEMWSVQVYDKDKRILTNGIVTHNSDNVLALFRDETMIADQEMGVKVLKQREGECGKVFMQWDFDHMKFGTIYAERESGEDTASFEDGEGTVKNTFDLEGDEQ